MELISKIKNYKFLLIGLSSILLILISFLIIIFKIINTPVISSNKIKGEVIINNVKTDNNYLTATDNSTGNDNVIESDNIAITLTTISLIPTVSISSNPTTAPSKTPIPTIIPTLLPTIIPTARPTAIIISPTVAVIDYSKPWQVATNCPITTMNCVPCTSLTASDCRLEVGKDHGFRGWACQDNSPGNIRPAAFKNTMIVAMGGTAACGQRNDIRGGAYMVFKDYSTGKNSLKAYLKAINAGMHGSYTNCGNCTLEFFGKTYGGSPTYGITIGGYLGVDATTTMLNTLVPSRLDELANAMERLEGFITQ